MNARSTPLACISILLSQSYFAPVRGEEASRLVEGLSLPCRVVTVSSPVQEILAEVHVEEGDRVTAGQPLAELFSEKDRIELRRFEKVLAKRQFDHRASRNLLEKQLLSQEKALAAEADLEMAQVDYDLAKVTLEEKTVRSPIDGIVIRRLVEPGESADRMEPLFEVVNIDQLHLQFYVEPDLLHELEPGQTVAFFMENPPGRRGEATVDFISPSADPQSGLFRVKLIAANPGHVFRAGVRVTAQFPMSRESRPDPSPAEPG